MTVLDFEVTDLADILGSPDFPCDNADHDWCQKGAQEWAVLVKCPYCKESEWRLWCDPCKGLVTHTEDGFQCARCEELVFPARRFVSRFERIEKR